MDPLSITAAILAILGACSAAIKALKSAYASPQEYTRLKIELVHLHEVIGDVNRMVEEHRLIGDTLIKNLTLAENKLQEVNKFIHESLRHSGRSPMERTTLASHKNEVEIFAKDIQGLSPMKRMTLARHKDRVVIFAKDIEGLSPMKRMTLARHKDQAVVLAKDIETVKAHILDSIMLSNL